MAAAKTRSQAVKFLLGGCPGVLAYYAASYVLTDWFRVHYLASATIAFALNYTLNFLFHKFWAFGDTDRAGSGRQFTQYAVMVVGFYAGTALFLYLLVHYGGWHYLAAQLATGIVQTCISFVLTRTIFSRELRA